MKQTCLFFLAGLCLACGFVSQVAAQGLPQFVAVADVAQLLKNHPDFKVKQETLQKAVQAEEARFRERHQQIIAKEKALKTSTSLQQGSSEYQKAMEDVAGLYADFDKDAKTMQRRFAVENSKIMYETYKDIKETIGKFAKARKIAQVTDYRIFEPNPLEPQSVIEEMDQKLVWYDSTLDITDLVIGQMYADRNLPRPPAETKTATVPQPAGGAAAGIR